MSSISGEHITAAAQQAAEDGFAGVVRVDVDGATLHASAHGAADRAHAIPNTVDTQFAAASGLKGCTAVAVMSLVQDGVLTLDTNVVSILPDTRSFVDPAVTVRHLLAHRSGIAEYCAEIGDSPDDPTTRVLVPAPCALEQPSSIVAVMDGVPALAPPDTEFRYNNTGYVVLALLAEAVTGTTFVDVVSERVLTPAHMSASGILRYDELGGDVAVGYRDRTGLRTNVHAVPNCGLGDGGLFTTAADMVRFWAALTSGALLDPRLVAEMATPHGHTPRGSPYGLGVWLDPATDALTLEGYDVGISFRSVHQPSTAITWTVASNWTDGAWPLAEALAQLLEPT